MKMKAPTKSQVDYYVDLCSQLIACDPLCIASSKSLARDIETLQSRVEYEGVSFLTKTLAKLGKALDEGLMSSLFTCPCEFSHGSGSKPAFMQVYFNRVFDEHGCLLDNADPLAVKHLRQVLFFAYKLDFPTSSNVNRAAIAQFVRIDGELRVTSDEETLQIIEVASYLTIDIFRDFDPKEILPKHGPGAVATGEFLEEKWEFSRLYNKIHQLYPYYDFFIVGGARELADRLDWYKDLERRESGTARLILVPKDSRGPRLISSEPLEFQWIQQGLGRKLAAHLESFWMTGGQINFTDQTVNQKLALASSLTGEYATLDLSDASDRVSLSLVQNIFKRCPLLLRCLEACRSGATTLPSGEVIPLNKFAPMGSATCFPVEAFVFWVLMVAAVSRHYKIPPRLVGKRVFVYGDDIIIPVEWVSLCIQTLTSCQLVVNKRKSCTTGFFRESCGTDAFKGVVVTPLRLRKQWSGRKSDGSAYAAYVSLANELSKDYKLCSDFIWERIEQCYGVVPHGTALSSFPCKIVADPDSAEEFNLQHFPHRTSRRYQRIEFYLPSLSSRKVKSKLDGWARLLRDVVSQSGDDPSTVVVPRSTSIKRSWRAVY